MPAHHARTPPLVAAGARHSPRHGCALRLAQAHSGIAQIPDNLVAEALRRRPWVEVLAGHRPAAMPISVVRPSQRLQPPRVRALLDALEPLRQRRPGRR